MRTPFTEFYVMSDLFKVILELPGSSQHGSDYSDNILILLENVEIGCVIVPMFMCKFIKYRKCVETEVQFHTIFIYCGTSFTQIKWDLKFHYHEFG